MFLMKFGVDYYPEHWPKERWAIDAQLMKEAGIELVRLAEFSWVKMEPESGIFDFSWLEEAIELLAGYGITSVLGTPSAAPPIWLIEHHPDILPVNDQGKRLGFGGRHHCCQSNRIYRDYVSRFVTAMARQFRSNPHVIGWQTDNEFGNSHLNLCLCDSCRTHFHQWLENKYGTIDRLNETWGTVFWSQTYSRFEQIPAPLPNANSHNPSLLLDWKRFASDLIVDFQKVQIEILRKECPHQFITHNFMGFFDKTNYFDLAKDLDFISHDQYPQHFKDGRDLTPVPHKLAMALDLMRGTKQKSFWIMEQQSGPTGWETISETPRPGQLRLWTYQTIAHGADTVVFFRWRSCLFGTEEYWHGILPHNGKPGRRYDEIKQTIQELYPHMEHFQGGLPKSEAAILYSYDQNWAFQIQPHHPELNYLKHLQGYYKAFYDQNVSVDIISEGQDFSRYKLLVAPLQFLTKSELTEKFRTFVAQGGSLVISMRSGVKDWNNAIVPETLPGHFSDFLGIEIDDYDCLREISQSACWLDSQLSEPVQKWCDIITPVHAKALAVYEQDFYQSTPAITENQYKKGTAYYVGTELGENLMAKFVSHILEKDQISSLCPAASGLEVTQRMGKNGEEYLFVLNHSKEPKEVEIPSDCCVLTGMEVQKGILSLPPFGVALMTKAKSPILTSQSRSGEIQ
jgi:beta-galactosidase